MASRRKVASADESTYSVDSETKRDADVALKYLAAADLASLPDAAIIQRSLNVKAVVSTFSSFAKRSQEASSLPHLQAIVQIGAGFQGAVFEQLGKSIAMKKEFAGNAGLRTSLQHEVTLHRAVTDAFDRFEKTVQSGVHVPRIFQLVLSSNDEYWNRNLTAFPAPYASRGNMVIMERILPLPKVLRKALITHFHPRSNEDVSLDSATIDAILSDTSNKHCLARTYLGRRDGVCTAEKFSLRDFPLYMQPMGQLGMDIMGLASSMGKAFAIMHWGAGVNGDDVEFVLGSSALKNEDEGIVDFQHRKIGFYLLDFGQCDAVDLTGDPEVVYQAFKGAMVTGDNQLFIPHYQKTPAAYAAFRTGYLFAASIILREKGLQQKFKVEDFMEEYEEYAEDFLG